MMAIPKRHGGRVDGTFAIIFQHLHPGRNLASGGRPCSISILVDEPDTGLSAFYFGRLARFASRTPAPPPFSAINSIPPFCNAATSFSAVSGRPPIGPSELSNRAIVGSETRDSLAKSLCDQANRARAAFSCRIEINLPPLIEFLLIAVSGRANRNSISEAF
jgi:hypothetical protein